MSTLQTPPTPVLEGSPEDPRWFRNVLGHFPTGVVVVTAMTPSGPVGMAVGSFTSVSLDPPMVAFLPDRSSSTFSHIREAGAFCINVLSADQADLCRQFARRGADKFAGVDWTPCASGAPRLAGAVAWIDCRIADIHDAGDHHIVVGHVDGLGLSGEQDPLLFFQGGYGRFSSLSLAIAADIGNVRLLRQIELVRPRIERLAADLDMEALAVTRQGDEMLIVASARTADAHGVATRVGQRMPLVAPLGALLVAWEDDATRRAWIEAAPPGSDDEDWARLLERVRERGWSLGLMTPTFAHVDRLVNDMSATSPTRAEREELAAACAELQLADSDPVELSSVASGVVRSIAAPVFDTDGRVAFTVVMSRPRQLSLRQLEQERDWILAAASQMSAELGATDTCRRS